MNHPLVNHLRTALLWCLALLGLTWLGLFAGQAQKESARQQEPLAEEDLLVFGRGLEGGWQDWSWADRSLPDREMKMGQLPAIRMEAGGHKGLYLHRSPFSLKGYKTLSFWIHGGARGGQNLSACLTDAANAFGPKASVAEHTSGRAVPAGRFELCVIPLEKLGGAGKKVSGICIQDASGGAASTVYLADLRFGTGRRRIAPDSIVVTVDATRRIGPISPYIYSMSQASPQHYEELRLKLWRWGGNPATRYNWEKGNSWNAARDWEFRNGNYSHTSPQDRQPSGVADQAIAQAKTYGADAYITIPTMGWVARDDNNNTRSQGVPNQTGPPVAPGSEAIAGYDPTENRQRVSVRSLPRKGKPFSDSPDLSDDVVYQDEWVHHLTRKFGKASAGGVRFYAMDNEPDLWDSTHTDMHPVRPDYDAILNQFLTYANAVKDVDPSAQIAGPTSWGWTGYFFSPRDRGEDTYRAHADRTAHGDMPLLAWFLQQVAAHDKRAGRRTLDVLDVHYYPQAEGVYGGRADPATNALRLRSTRSLWDPTYSDESWIGTQVQLIPRLRQWVEKYYPGTKIGIMEWNWGADDKLNGGIAVGEALGIFGRERLDMACYWAIPGYGTPGFFAYKMYRNADGQGGGFGEIAVAAESNAPRNVSCFGSVDAKTGRPVLMLINKMASEDAVVTVKLASKQPVSAARVWRYSGAQLKKIVEMPDIVLTKRSARMTLPACSMTLLRCR